MSLKVLPDIVFPITSSSINPLVDSMVLLNKQDGCLPEESQRALGIYLHIYDLWAKTNGRLDYRGKAGHERLKQDAARFVTSGSLITRHGDLAACHLAIDYSDTVIRCAVAGLPALPTTVSQLMDGCMDLASLSQHDEKQLGLLLDVLGKRSPSLIIS